MTRAEQEKILRELRKESEPREESASGRQGALRKTNVSKAPKANLLNVPAVVPTARDEIDLMLACVSEAQAQRNAKGTVWYRAEKLYFAAFLNNATIPESERKFLRGPVTAASIETTFKGYATAQKAFVAAREDEELAFTPPQFDAGSTLTAAAALALTSIAAQPSAAECGSCAAESGSSSVVSKPAAKLNPAARWKRKIDAGEALHVAAISGLSRVAAAEYLRAMGETVAREADVSELHAKLKAKLGSESK